MLHKQCGAKRLIAVALTLLLCGIGAAAVYADSQYVAEDKFYEKREDGISVYVSPDHYLYHFSGEIAGVTVCGYQGKKEELEIPEEINGRVVSAIDDYAFADDDRITSITFPESLLAIGEGSFCGCAKLESVTFSSSVTELTNVFCDCPRLREITFPYGVTAISGSFRNCVGLRSVTFSRSVNKLEDGSFNGCSALEHIEWSTGLSRLGDAFDGCQMLTTIHIPKGVVMIDGAFDDCAFAEVLELPDSLLYINSGFNRCSALCSLTLPEELVYIGDAFADCTSLRGVVVPSSVELYGAFERCTGVTVEQPVSSSHYVLITAAVVLLLCGLGVVTRKIVDAQSHAKGERQK